MSIPDGTRRERSPLYLQSFLFFGRCTVFKIVHSRDTYQEISENYTLPVLKDVIHIDALQILSQNVSTKIDTRLTISNDKQDK